MSTKATVFSTSDDFPIYTDERTLTAIPKDSEFYKSIKKVFAYIEENYESAEEIWQNIEEIAHNALGEDGEVAEFFLNEPENNNTYFNAVMNIRDKLTENNAILMQRVFPYNAIKSLQGTAWVNFLDFTYFVRQKVLGYDKDTPIEPSEFIVWINTLRSLTSYVVEQYFNIVGTLSHEKLVEIHKFMEIVDIKSNFSNVAFDSAKDLSEIKTEEKEKGKFDLNGWNPDGQKH